jgi:Siphovirus ReqiPepy6 Gp37-like protein
MEVFTLNRKFLQQEAIDVFHSIIWTEKYYGDSEVELVVPLTSEMIQKLIPGVFLGISGSNEIMMLESMTIEEEKMKFKGISILPWLNNRFVRTTVIQKDKTFWRIPEAGSPIPTPGTPGWTLWAIVYFMCCQGSPYLNGTIDTGIDNPERLAIPGLTLKDYDKSGDPLSIDVAYEPVYDALRKIAETYHIGMQITLESATDSAYVLGFRSYKGLDRTTGQTVNPPVRFSPEMDSLANIKEIQSIAALKTQVYAFATNDLAPLVSDEPGVASLTGPQYTGFDLRALQVLTTDIVNPKTTDTPPGIPLDKPKLLNLLNEQAKAGLYANPVYAAVDGEIVPENQFQYGRDYNLGDIIEIQGNSDVVSVARVTEYIRSQDEAGERSYPTVAMLD